MITTISRKLGVQEDLIRLAFLFILNINLCKLWKLIESPYRRKLFSLVGGVFFLTVMLQKWALYVILSAVISYYLISMQKKQTFLASIILGFGFLLSIHIYRTVFDFLSWKIDCSVMQMFMTTKIVYLGKYLSRNKQSIGLFDFLSYALFFPGVLIGPTLNYQTFDNFIHRKKQYSDIKYENTTPLVLQGVFWAAMTVFVSSRFPSDWVCTNQFYLSLSFPLKIVVVSLMNIVYRIKFYTGWSFTQAAINNSGISYDEKGGYTAVQCGTFRYELQHNPRIKTLYWNISVSRWISECFYQPLTAMYPRNKLIPTLGAFGASALWHGIYPSYFFGFVHWAFVNQVSRLCYKASHLVAKYENNRVYRIILWTCTHTIMGYVGIMVVVLGSRQLFKFLNDVYWWGTFVVAGIYLFFMLNPKLLRDSAKSKPSSD